MSTKRTTGYRGYVIDLNGKAFGPNRRQWCRWHGFYLLQYIEVPKGRIAYCNNDCAHQYRLRNEPSYVRYCVEQRDRGVCARCGLDTEALKDAFNRSPWAFQAADGQVTREQLRGMLRRQGYDPHVSLWQADHIVPVVEGGGECGLDNYRTLCTPCHRLQTRALRKRLALQRNPTGPTARAETRRRLMVPLPLEGVA